MNSTWVIAPSDMPPVGAGPDSYRTLVDELQAWTGKVEGGDAVGFAPGPLIDLLSELHRRRERSEQPGSSVPLEAAPAIVALISAINRLLTAQRAQARTDHVTGVIKQDPLRARVLTRLAAAPSRPGRLATVLGSALPTVSRCLATLLDGGLVTATQDPGDRRGRLYALTSTGEAVARDLIVHGPTPAPSPPDDDDDAREYLVDALDLAVADRRTRVALDEVATRIEAVIAEARRRELIDIEVDARREMLTTLRHAQRWEERAPHEGALDALARRGRPRTGVEGIQLAAFAHLRYERGALAPAHTDEDLVTQATHLLASADVAAFLASGLAADTDAWRRREGFALLGAADNLRQQTRFGPGYGYADKAAMIFEETGEIYGTVRALFQKGYCLRLRGHFAPARAALEAALASSEEHGYRQFRADIVAQLGEVLRCLGDYDAANARLAEAELLGGQTGRSVTATFARAARGAVEVATGDIDGAIERLSECVHRFREVGHPIGHALAVRRLAVAQRIAASGGRAFPAARAEEHFATARRLYEDQNSPAGEAACVVGAGHLVLDQRRRIDGVVETLVRLLDADFYHPAASLIELDPYVPALVTEFAERVDHAGLSTRARRLQALADRKRQQHRKETSVPTAPGQMEMGGEPRRRAGPISPRMLVASGSGGPISP